MKVLTSVLVLLSVLPLFAVTGVGYSELVSFDTVDPQVELIAPHNESFFPSLSTININWWASDANLAQEDIRILFSQNGGIVFSDSLVVPNTGSYAWQGPDATIMNTTIRVVARDSFGNIAHSQNPNPFIIGPNIPAKPLNVTMTSQNIADLLVSWEPVSQGTFGQPLNPDGYLVFYSELSPIDDDTYFLLENVTSGNTCLHRKTLEHWDTMFYKVIAYQNLNPILLSEISAAKSSFKLSDYMKNWNGKRPVYQHMKSWNGKRPVYPHIKSWKGKRPVYPYERNFSPNETFGLPVFMLDSENSFFNQVNYNRREDETE